MDLGLKGRIALVTGGSKGIGGATAMLLAREGAYVAISARHTEELDEMAARISRETGGQVLAVPADCTKQDEVSVLVRQVLDRWGRIDVLVNSIGAAKAGIFLQLSDDDWQQSLALKLFGQIRVAREVFPHMQKQSWGRIVNVIGTHALLAEAHAMPAGVANAGLMNFTKALAELGGPYGVLVNAVSPGTVRTARLEYLMSQGVEYNLKTITLGRFAEAEEIANAIVFLASERASYVCGSFLTVDGGQIKCI
ncbi:MAG: SDR family oxidoreductase [Betaproteobacteria bacterium]|nr:SDR family oxidoreductase [Betaproteobacteria bacterium]